MEIADCGVVRIPPFQPPMLSRFFQLESRGTTPGREVQAGITTFAAMAYILAVNPTILATTGMDKGAWSRSPRSRPHWPLC